MVRWRGWVGILVVFAGLRVDGLGLPAVGGCLLALFGFDAWVVGELRRCA